MGVRGCWRAAGVGVVAVLLVAATGCVPLGPGGGPARAGTLDARFGSGGLVTTDVGALGGGFSAEATALAVQPDGKIVVAGAIERFQVGSAIREMAIARYDRRGVLDASFGAGGLVVVGFGVEDVSEAQDVVVQRDGKIVVAGNVLRTDDQANTRSEIALVRLRRDGRVDAAFGEGGRVRTAIADGSLRTGGLAVQADGRLVVAGTAEVDGIAHFAVARYRSDGAPDPSLGGDGLVTADASSGDPGLARDVVVQPDGKIVAAGTSLAGEFAFALARYRPDGRLDPGFGGDGTVTTDFAGGGLAFGVALGPDGRVVVAGGSGFDVAVARYRRDGSIDRGFGGDGRVTTAVEGTWATANAVMVQPDGRVVVAGSTFVPETFTLGFVLVRYRRDGTPDPAFGSGGVVATPFPGPTSVANDLAAQRDGRIVVAGITQPDPNQGRLWALAGYHTR